MSWTHHTRTPAAVLIAGLLGAGCFFGDDRSRDEEDFDEVREGLDEAAEGLGRAATAMREALEGMADEFSAEGLVDEPLNFRELYAVLPDRVGDFERTAREGKTEGAMGFDVSQVEARYENGAGGRIDLEITDMGALPTVALMGMVEWADYEIDEESDRGWKRTLEYEGYPAMEEFRRSDGDRGRGEFTYFVERRFAVKIEGRGVTMDEVHDFRDRIATDDLADMKDREG